MDIFAFFEKVSRRSRCFIKTLYYKARYNSKLIVGKKVRFNKRFNLFSYGSLQIGNQCFFNDDCSLNCLDKIEIGNNCLFGKNVNIYDHNHLYGNGKLVRKSGYKTKPVKIGNNVWLGTNVTILMGVEIGDNVVVGAGCVVFKSIPANRVVVNRQNLNYQA